VVTAAQWRELALSMPEAEEKAHFGNPDFRVANKIFCGMDAAGAWGVKGWTHVRLREASLGELRPLVEDAWRTVAPRSLTGAGSRRRPTKTR
jgi:hypothetical protein